LYCILLLFSKKMSEKEGNESIGTREKMSKSHPQTQCCRGKKEIQHVKVFMQLQRVYRNLRVWIPSVKKPQSLCYSCRSLGHS
jgi:hypothetical protein